MPGAHISDRGYDLGQILDTPMIAMLSLCANVHHLCACLTIQGLSFMLHGEIPPGAHICLWLKG